MYWVLIVLLGIAYLVSNQLGFETSNNIYYLFTGLILAGIVAIAYTRGYLRTKKINAFVVGIVVSVLLAFEAIYFYFF